MIEYEKLTWSNCFSYGEGNSIDFTGSPITQIVGKNGNGKSSIALILEEVIYNKNSKGIKKSAILNRNSSAKQYSIALDFKRDGIPYRIETTRGSTQKVALYRNGEDISSHTATATFKDIENLIGYDHKTFSQIVYQSSTQSLEFLTATDTARKKFLIDLLNLGKYTKALDVFKEEASQVSKDLAVVEGKLAQANQWIDKYKNEKLEKQQEVLVPEMPDDWAREVSRLRVEILNIAQTNKQRLQNAEYKKLRDSVIIVPAPTDEFSQATLDGLRTRKAVCQNEITRLTKEVASLSQTKDKCPTCGSSLGVDLSHIHEKVRDKNAEITKLKQELLSLDSDIATTTALQAKWQKAKESQELYEKYHGLYNPEIPEELLDADTLSAEASSYEKQIQARQKEIDLAKKYNADVAVKNARIDMIVQQRAEIEAEIEIEAAKRNTLLKRQTNLSVLVKAFSTTGLVAYKIECLVKDLEEQTNKYLLEMADGRFQLGFQISSSDKLNVVITDNGQDVEMAALSSGERARVNIAALLAIRKLMQGLSNTKTNLLVLDETIENLDSEGKERLIEVLLAEEGLNTFLISHGFSHPLLEKISVVKRNNISRIEQ